VRASAAIINDDAGSMLIYQVVRGACWQGKRTCTIKEVWMQSVLIGRLDSHVPSAAEISNKSRTDERTGTVQDGPSDVASPSGKTVCSVISLFPTPDRRMPQQSIYVYSPKASLQTRYTNIYLLSRVHSGPSERPCEPNARESVHPRPAAAVKPLQRHLYCSRHGQA
jgi:hypothetical protein